MAYKYALDKKIVVGGVTYQCKSINTHEYSHGNEKVFWFYRNFTKYLRETVILHLGERDHVWVTCYINNVEVEGSYIVPIDSNQIADLLDAKRTLPELFEYCRIHFCPEFQPIVNARAKKQDNQLDMFGDIA